MERLVEDASNIKDLLPWITSEEEIVNFMRKIPLDKSCIRNHLTIRYFLNSRDSHDDEFEQKIEEDAKKIVVVLPNIASYKEIKDHLTVLGNMQNRKEVVIRQLLQEQKHLNKVVREMDVNGNNKRKPEPVDFEIESNTTGNLKIKIRRKEVSLDIEAEKTSPEQIESPDQVSSSSSNSSHTPFTFGANYSESNSVDLNSLSPDMNKTSNIVPIPEFVRNSLKGDSSNDVSRKYSSTTSESIMPVNTRSATYNHNNNIETPSGTIIETVNYDFQPSTSKAGIEIIKPSVLSKQLSNNLYNNNNNGLEEFNLVEYLKEVTYAPKERILIACRKYGLKLSERPSDKQFNHLVHILLDNEPVEISDNDSEDTEEYHVDPLDPYILGSSNDVSNTKEFKLRPSVLNLNNERPVSSNCSVSKVHIKPATFVPTKQTLDLSMDVSKKQEDIENLGVPVLNEINVPIDISTNSNNNIVHKKVCNELDLLEAGPSTVETQKKRVVDERLVFKLMEMFPEALPDYIRDLCDGKQWIDFDFIVTNILSDENYPKRPQRAPSPIKEVDLEEQFEIVKKFLPDADPDYLRMQCEKYSNDENGLQLFVNEAMELKNYPTMKEYLRKQQLSAQQKQYTTDFNIEHFIELFPDPFKTFMDPNRNVKVDAFSSHYLNVFFKNRYEKIPVRTIQHVLTSNNYKIVECDKTFKAMVKTNLLMKSRRKPVSLPDSQNIPLLQELAFLKNKSVIQQYLKEKKIKEENERIIAEENGLMESCECCFDDKVMPKDTFTCPNGCKFCRDCIQKSCEVALGEGKTTFQCLANCSDEFSLQTLQIVLPPKMFSKLAQKKALAEIKAAGIEELEMCPFCDFASIPNEADKIFRCLNPDCMKESCRLCKEPNHVPLKCDEVEKDEDVKARTYVENKMSEALIRKCWKCGTSFFKEEGCNKMTCSCGAHMCYICKEPVRDYSHFNGIGGDQFDLCPLYSDTNLVNEQNVMGAAANAKAKVDPTKLKVDPTVDVKKHFEERKKMLPREPHLDLINANHNRIPGVRLPPAVAVPQFNQYQGQDRRRHLPEVRIWNGNDVGVQVHNLPEGQQGHVRVVVRRHNRRH